MNNLIGALHPLGFSKRAGLESTKRKDHQNPDPLKAKGSATRKSETVLRVDVMEWYHPTMLSRQEKSSRRGWPPAIAFGGKVAGAIIACHNEITGH